MNWIDVEYGYEMGYEQGKAEQANSASLLQAIMSFSITLIAVAFHLLVICLKVVWMCLCFICVKLILKK